MSNKKRKKVFFSDIDAATITQRYDATTVLTVLQELWHYPDWKFDWNELVKKTSTCISNAREYQLLWRHLAYLYSLPENLEQGDESMVLDDDDDDDSDLDCELESLHSVSAESKSESSACVKVMIASRTLGQSTPSSSTIEAPLTVNFPVFRSYLTPEEGSLPSNLMEQTSIKFPVTVHRQTLSTGSSTVALDTKGTVGVTNASKRKRNAWSEEEDNQLRAAVQKWGEGNWATMAKGDDFPIKRSATQLSQRWSTLRKKDGSANSGIAVTNTQSTTTDNYLATRHSLNLALDMPFKKLTSSGMNDPGSLSIKNQVQSCNPIQVSTVCSSVPPQRPSQQACGAPAKSKLASEYSLSKCNAMLARETKTAIVNSGAQTVSPKLTPENTVSKCNEISAREPKPATAYSGALTVPHKLASENPVSKCNAVSACGSKPAIFNSGAPTVPHKLPSENPVSKCNAISAREPKPATVNSGALTVPHKLASENPVSKCNAVSACGSKPAIFNSGALTVPHKLPSENPVSKCNAISAREPKPATVNSGALTVPHKLASENPVSKCHAVSACGSKPAIFNSGALTVPHKLPSENPVSKCNAVSACGSKPAIFNSGSLTVPHKLPSVNPVSKCNAISAREAKSVIVNSGSQTVSRSNAVPQQVRVSQAKNVAHVPAGSPLTKTTISAGLPSDQKDKYVTSVKEEGKKVFVPGSTPKEKAKEEESTTPTTQGQVDSKLDKAKLDLDKAKSMLCEKSLEHKALSQNPRGCEGQGSVKNSSFTLKETTENGNDNLNKASQDLNQDKNTSSINGSLNHQSMNEKLVNLPKQGECCQGLEVP